MLLQNVKASRDPDAADNVRKFELKINEYTNDIKVDGTLEMASFFDAYDNGFLDILVVSSKGDKDKKYKIDAFQNNLGIDATWIKAMVYTAYCDPVTGEQCRLDSSWQIDKGLTKKEKYQNTKSKCWK